jgi:signal transduction histidine kinase
VFASIRWRLAAGYAALIVLSVCLMGALALLMVGRHVQRQEGEYLAANAAAVALQAGRFMEPQVRRIALEELAFTSAFLGDARVRILGRDESLIADSGAPGAPDEFLWVVPSDLAEVDPERRGTSPFVLPLPPNRDRGERPDRRRDHLPFLRDLPLGSSRVVARRMLTPWGRRFEFEMEWGGLPPGAPRLPPGPDPQVRSIRVPVGDAASPVGFVEMSSPLSPSGEVLAVLRRAVLLAGIGSLVVAVAFGLLMGKTLTDPLRGLAQTARRMADGDLAARAPDRRRDEIGSLARQFNSMAASLETSFRDLRSERDSLRRFIADASHELRTPITALATFNELLQGSAAADPAAREEFLAESAAQLKRLEWITANLLDLSRLDAGIASLTMGEHSAGDILSEAAAGVRLLAAEKRVALEVRAPEVPLLLTCDRDRMVLAVLNLLSNAVKFTPAGGSVSASAVVEQGPQASAVLFRVRDTGPGIDPEDLPRIFERFFRGRNAGDDAPGREGPVGGVGLGLAIVQSVARAHGGSVTAHSAPGEGSTFDLAVPGPIPAA